MNFVETAKNAKILYQPTKNFFINFAAFSSCTNIQKFCIYSTFVFIFFYLTHTLWYQKATYTNIFFLKKLRTVKFETTVETNNKSISRQTTMVFDYLHQTILIR